MDNSKTALAAAISAMQKVGVAFDSESAAAADALDKANADRDALSATVASQATQIASLKAVVAELDPWAAIDKTGATEVTALVQSRVDAGENIPAGRFLIDPTRPILFKKNCDGATNPDGTPATIFVAKPSATARDCIYKVVGTGITVRNIRAVGDRMAKLYTAGTTNEWGYGGMVTGAGSTIENCYAERCTGDGYGIAAPDVTVKDCISDKNRRQGLSGFNCDGLKIIGGAFTNTGTVTIDGVVDAGAPAGPWAGIDIEPDAPAPGQPAPKIRVLIDGAKITGNDGAGIESWLRAEVGGSLEVTIQNCQIEDSPNLLLGKALAGSVSLTVIRNIFGGTRKSNVRAEGGCSAKVGTTDPADANVSSGLAQRYALQAVGPSPRAPGVIVAGVNKYA